MQVKCPHCRYKYSEALRPGITELVSICPRCGESFPLEVTEEDIQKEQAPPLPVSETPTLREDTTAGEPPVVPAATQSPEMPVFTVPSVTGHDAMPEVPAAAPATQKSAGASAPMGGPQPHYNYSPSGGGIMKSMPGIIIFLVVAAITAGGILTLSTIFGKDETEPVDTISSFINASDMTKGEMGNFSYSFEGNIIGKKKIPIRMKLMKTGSQIEGTYYYVNQKERTIFELKGKVSDDGSILLREYNEGNEDSGSFEGTLSTDDSFKGTFRYEKSKYDFELKKVKNKPSDE